MNGGGICDREGVTCAGAPGGGSASIDGGTGTGVKKPPGVENGAGGAGGGEIGSGVDGACTDSGEGIDGGTGTGVKKPSGTNGAGGAGGAGVGSGVDGACTDGGEGIGIGCGGSGTGVRKSTIGAGAS